MTRSKDASPTGSGDGREGRWRTLGDTPDEAAARAGLPTGGRPCSDGRELVVTERRT